MNYSLPHSVEIDGKKHEFRTDFRVILEIIEMLSDTDFNEAEKCQCLLEMFYIDSDIQDIETAIKECYAFIDMGKKPENKKQPRLIDWEQDFNYIIAPVNRVLGYECRAIEYNPAENKGGVHWWTFLSAYMEIGGDCLLSQIVSIRDKRARGAKLEKYEIEWAKRNASLIRIKPRFSDSEKEILAEFAGEKIGRGH